MSGEAWRVTEALGTTAIPPAHGAQTGGNPDEDWPMMSSMQPSQSTWRMKPYVYLFPLALTACKEAPNPDVCCTTDADCARLGGILPRGCPDGFVCRELLCEAADCATAADCPIEQPVCDLDSASCTGCTTSSDCDGYPDAPVCDSATGGCRACALDAECASEVCDVETGRCVAESEIIYASPSGSDTAGCTHGRPCSVARAIVVASADPSSSLVRLLPGTYGTPIVVSSGTTTFVGPGVLLRLTSATTAVQVSEAAIVEIRGLEIDSPGGVRSTGTGALFPVLTLRDSTIRDGTAFAEHGILRMLRSSVMQGQFPRTPVSVHDDGIFEADQARFEGTDSISVNTLGRRMRVRITNSIFEHGPLGMNNGDETPDRSEYYVSFSTFLLDREQICENPYNIPRIAVLENNIFVASSGQVQSVIHGTACTLAGNITFPQNPDLGGTNIDQDPRFVNLQGGDCRLQPGSPAVDAAVPSSGSGLDHDFAGTPRPQGGRKDIGAFELVP